MPWWMLPPHYAQAGYVVINTYLKHIPPYADIRDVLRIDIVNKFYIAEQVWAEQVIMRRSCARHARSI